MKIYMEIFLSKIYVVVFYSINGLDLPRVEVKIKGCDRPGNDANVV